MEMNATTACANPMCSCDDCRCDDCMCGVARLGDLERRVMKIVWESDDPESSVREVARQFPGYAYTTVATVLDRLHGKGMLHRRMEGRTIRYSAVGSQGAHTTVLMRRVLDDGHDPDAALRLFVQGLSKSESSTLRRALTRLRFIRA